MVAPTGPSNAQYLYVADRVASLGAFRQYASETIAFTVDYGNWLSSGETVASASYGVFPLTGPALAVVGSSISGGMRVSFQLSGGVPETEYQVWVQITTSTGQQKSNLIVVVILDSDDAFSVVGGL